MNLKMIVLLLVYVFWKPDLVNLFNPYTVPLKLMKKNSRNLSFNLKRNSKIILFLLVQLKKCSK